MNKRLLATAITVFLLMLAVVQPAFATQYTASILDPSYCTVWSGISGVGYKVAINFQATETGYLNNIALPVAWIGDAADIDVLVSVGLYGCGVNSNPNATVYATSAAVDPEASFDHYDGSFTVAEAVASMYNFGFNATYQVIEGQWYAIVYSVDSGTLDPGTDEPGIFYAGDIDSYPGVFNVYVGGWGAGVDTNQISHRVTVTDVLGELYSNSATPTPNYTGDDGVDDLINDLINFLLPIIVMLIPAVLLGYVMRMGKWGYIIGLAIGTGLGVMFISGFPVWLAFLVTIGLIGFAYQEVRRGG